MLLRCIPCFLVINLRFIRGCTRTISTNLCFFLVYQLNIFPFNFCFVNYSVVYKSKAEPLEHTKKRDTGHQSVSLENKTGDSTVLKIGNSAKVVIKQDMKGRRHKYGFNNNKREKAEMKRVVDDETGDKHQLDEIMGSPPASTPPLPPPPPSDALASPSAVKRTCKASRLRSLSTRPPGSERPVVHVDPATGKADGPHKKKLRTCLGIMACDKGDITYENWKEVPTAQKDLIWEDIQAEFDIPEAFDSRMKRKLLQTFKSDLTRKWALAADQDGVEDTVCEKYDISKEKWAQFCQTRRDPSWEDVRMKAQAIQKQNTAPHVLSRGGYDYLEQKLLAEKMKKLEEAAQSGSVDGVIDPSSPVRRHVKWKMAHTKKTGEMTTEAAKEIAEKIDSFEEQAIQGSFVPHGRQDVLAVAIRRPEHPGRARAAGAGVTIKQYFGSAPRTSHSASSMPLDELQQLTQQIRDQLEESITKKVMRQVMASFIQLLSQMQSQGLAVPFEPLVGPSGPRVSTKGSCVDPSGNDPETGDSDRCGLYIEADSARLVAMGRVYEGSTVVHNTPLLPGQVKVSVEEVTDADAPVHVPTDEVVVSPTKPPPKPDLEVDDPLYLMTLIIPELFLRPYQVRWDATMFGVFNPDFPLYIKHEDLSEIAHGGQCLSISVLQLWILHLTETCMRVGNSDIYGFLEPHGHWQMVVILPKEHLVVWFCSLHNRPDNYLKGIINSVIKGLDDAPQPKSKASARWIVVKCNRQKGSIECDYYVMHWMSTIILGTFRNNWEAYFNDPRPLELERLKALRMQWAQIMASPLASPPPPPPPLDASASSSALKRTCKASHLRSLSTRPPGADRPVVHVDPTTGKADGPHRKKLRTYLGIVARDKVDVTYENWKEVPTAQKDLIWEDIQDGVDDTVCDKYDISKEKWAQFCQIRRDPSWEDSFEEQATQGSFIPHGGYDVLTVAIGRLEHLGRVRVAGAEELQQLTQQIRDQLEESITEKVTRQFMASFSQMQSQGHALPPEPLVDPSGPQVSTKGSCVDPSGNDPETDDLNRYPARLVALGRVYEGSIVVHNTPLLPGQVKVGVEEVKDADAPVPVPIDEVSLVEQAIHTFLAWLTHLATVSPVKPPQKLDLEVDDSFYLMTLTIPELFLRPYQVTWDAIVFGVFNLDFLLYIKHEDLSEIAYGGQCLSILVLQLWILHLTETSKRAGNSDICEFLEPQSIQRSGQSQFETESYIKSWMQSSKCNVYLGAYLNGPDNYLKGIINRSVFFSMHLHSNTSITPLFNCYSPGTCNRQKGSTECGYYVMHWMSTVILGSFRNNWEAYFNDPRPLEPERLKALRIQWAQYYLRVRDQT
ncbi:hypothetical protein HKD37_03G007621 [Glycine soja]